MVFKIALLFSAAMLLLLIGLFWIGSEASAPSFSSSWTRSVHIRLTYLSIKKHTLYADKRQLSVKIWVTYDGQNQGYPVSETKFEVSVGKKSGVVTMEYFVQTDEQTVCDMYDILRRDKNCETRGRINYLYHLELLVDNNRSLGYTTIALNDVNNWPNGGVGYIQVRVDDLKKVFWREQSHPIDITDYSK